MAEQPTNPTNTETPAEQINAALAATAETDNPFVELGDSGLLRYGGFISEEWMQQAKGQNGVLLIKEMVDNHPIVGAMIFAIRMLMRGATWSIEAGSDAPADTEIAEFVESCLSDMQTSWQDTLTQMMSFLEFGWSMSEVVYKVRQGPDEEDPALTSQYTDKKIGIRKIAIRSQESLFKFEMDQAGDVLGIWQQPPVPGGLRFVPKDRLLHLRPTAYKDNPLGRSVLRNCMIPYLIQKKLQEIEAIGMERDLAGYPTIYAPGEIMRSTATPDQKKMMSSLKALLKNIRRDSSEGAILPSDTDKNGNRLYELKLLASAGSRQIEPDTAIVRYDQRIAMTMLADFVMIGNSGSGGSQRGSYGMAESKQDMFMLAISAWLDAICEEFNRQVIPRLLRLNNLKPAKPPKLVHGEVKTPSLAEIAAYVTALSGAGAPLFPDINLERWLRSIAGMPDPDADGTPWGDGDAADQINPVKPAQTQANPQPKADPASPAAGAKLPASAANDSGQIQ